MNIEIYIREIAQAARKSSHKMASASTEQKNRALLAITTALKTNSDQLLAANAQDMAKAQAEKLAPALLDRLNLTATEIENMVLGLEQVAALDDPIGAIDNLRLRPSGIRVGQMRVPLGVVGIIYESRPNVTADAAALCLKSGNSAILRGGKEALNSNLAIAECVTQGLQTADLPADAIQVLNTPDRAAVGCLLSSPEYVDVIVPRGGKKLIERISQEARMPVIKHLDGNCHVYIESTALADNAEGIVLNSKTQRLGTCNTAESMLIDRKVAEQMLPQLSELLFAKGVEIRGCKETCAIIPDAKPATDEDWSCEYLAAIISVKVVAGIDEAISHINQYSSHHTDTIVTEGHVSAMRFLREVDSASVMVNASTRFADGFEYGLGAEIGISTDKFHARGPVGLEGLTSSKWVVLGNGEVRS